MKITIVFLVLLAFAFIHAQELSPEEHEAMVKNFNVNTVEEFKARYLGLELMDLEESIPTANNEHLLEYTSIPASFDSRTQWPDCVGQIRNQERCGSCWAFSGSEVLTDRMCIASKGQIKEVLSPQYMVSCDKKDMGCSGGRLDVLWQFLENTGTVTDECSPYVSGNGVVPGCQATCEDGSRPRMFRAQSGSTRVFTKPEQIKLEIMTNGPVQTGFLVFADLMQYQKGEIYTRKSLKMLGGHAVKIVGWGQREVKSLFGTKKVNYWIIANSWGTGWGDEGFFLIKEGQCRVDSQVVAGQADVTSSYRIFDF